MGYRSDVKYKLLFATKEQRDTFVAVASLDVADIPYSKDIIDSFDFVDVAGTLHPYEIRVHYDDVKWYESDKWVDIQRQWMEQVAQTDGCGYAFLRIGEDDDDVATGYDGKDVYIWDHIEFNRYSVFQ